MYKACVHCFSPFTVTCYLFICFRRGFYSSSSLFWDSFTVFAIIKCGGINNDFPGDPTAKEPICQCRRCEFDPSVGKIPWRKKWQPTSVFLPGKIPQAEKAGGLPSMGLHRVRHDWAQTHKRACVRARMHTHTHTHTQHLKINHRHNHFPRIKNKMAETEMILHDANTTYFRSAELWWLCYGASLSFYL